MPHQLFLDLCQSGQDTLLSLVNLNCMTSRVSPEYYSSSNKVTNATGSVTGLLLSMSSLLNNGAISLFGRLPDSKVRSEVHTHRFLARNDSITTRTEYPSLVKLSANIVQVLTSSGCAIPEEHIVP